MPEPAQPVRVESANGLVDLLDALLDTGVVVAGELVVSLAGVDLLYVNLRALASSVETAAAGIAGEA